MESYPIRKIINKIGSGEMRIPSFQRGFVWEPDDVAFFVDSIFKGYPVGAVLLWRTHDKLHTERDLGRFSLPEPSSDYPLDYVLDGQQRLTSLFSVFQTELEPNHDENWKDVFYVIGSSEDPQQTVFLPLNESDVDPDKHFPINVLFDSVKYRKATEHLNDNVKKEIDSLQETFKEATIPVQLMETEDRGNVAIVFERINRAGVPLDSFQLLTAWSWSTEFDLQDKLDDLSNELSSCGFEDLANDQDLLMKCFTGFILGSTSPRAIMDLKGEAIRDNFDSIVNGLKSSVDFLDRELNLHSLSYLPYPAMIVSLTRFFGKNRTYNNTQRKELIRWFWRSCFSRRYSSGVNSAHESDLAAMDRLILDENAEISNFRCDIESTFFLANCFGITTVNTKTFIAMLASNAPRSFLSGAKVDLGKTLKSISSKEFHHIFPDKYLERLGYDRKKRFCLANFCFLNNMDNQKIKDKSPAEYSKLIDQTSLDEILRRAICPPETFSMSYDDFLARRADMLVSYAQNLIA